MGFLTNPLAAVATKQRPDMQAPVTPVPAQQPQQMKPPQQGPMGPSPFSMPVSKPNILQGALDSFQRGFDPAAYDARMKQGQADAQTKQKQTLALMQQQRALPPEQRAMWWQQNAPQISQIIGKDISSAPVDPSQFSDQALDQQIAIMSAQMGQGPVVPEPMSAYQQAQIGLERDRLNAPPKPQIYSTSKGLVEAAPGSDPRVVFGTDPEEKPPWVGAVKGPDGKWDWDPNYLKGRKALQQQAGGTSHQLRPATPEEAARYGPPGTMGQIDDATGRFYPTSRPNPQTGGMPTENERKFALYAQSAKSALKDIDALEFGGDYADGVKPQWERGNQMNPFDEKARKYDQAIDRFLDGWARAMTGAAMTKEEKEFYYGIMKPTFGDSEAVRIQKAQSRHKMAQNLEVAAARGMNAYNQQGPSGPQADPTDDAFIDGLFPEDNAGDQVPDGVDPQDWQYMTPEERALFQ